MAMRVVIMPDFHGVQESVEWQIKQFPMYARKPDKTVVLHEPLADSGYAWGLDKSKPKESVPFNYFWKCVGLEDCWGPSKSYRRFYQLLGNGDYSLRPLDIDNSKRNDLGRGFKHVAVTAAFIKNSTNLDTVEQAKIKDMTRTLCRDFDILKGELCFGREQHFAEQINSARYDKFETAVAVMHPSHIDRVGNFLKDTQGLDVTVAQIDPELAKKLGEEENRIQGEAVAKAIGGSVTMYPPFVPAVIAAFNEATPLYRQFEQPAPVA